MKIEVRRRIATGLVIAIQSSVIIPKIAETATNVSDWVSELNSFAAKPVDSTTPQSSAKLEIAVGNGTGSQISKTQDGDTASGDPTGGDPTGGDPTGGDPTGGDPTGGDPTGGDPTGGDPTGGDPTGGDPTGGDPTGGDPTGGDPTGGDPTGGDPTGCDPSAGDPTLIVTGSTTLLTDESGLAELLEVSLSSAPASAAYYQIASTKPDEARPFPGSLTFSDNWCVPQMVSVVGQNDGVVDGDIGFDIEFLNPAGETLLSLAGINLDNDSVPILNVDIVGPSSLMREEQGVYTIRVTNLGARSASSSQPGAEVANYSLFIESTVGLNLTGFICTFLSGNSCNAESSLSGNLLQLDGLNLPAGETLLLSVDVVLGEGILDTASLKARIEDSASALSSDNSESTTIAVFRSSFEGD